MNENIKNKTCANCAHVERCAVDRELRALITIKYHDFFNKGSYEYAKNIANVCVKYEQKGDDRKG